MGLPTGELGVETLKEHVWVGDVVQGEHLLSMRL